MFVINFPHGVRKYKGHNPIMYLINSSIHLALRSNLLRNTTMTRVILPKYFPGVNAWAVGFFSGRSTKYINIEHEIFIGNFVISVRYIKIIASLYCVTFRSTFRWKRNVFMPLQLQYINYSPF